jgi:hypothetical protein
MWLVRPMASPEYPLRANGVTGVRRVRRPLAQSRERLCFSFRWWAEPGRGGIAAPAALVQVPVAGRVMLVTLLGPGGEGVGRSRVCDGCCHRASFEVVVDVNVVAGALDW